MRQGISIEGTVGELAAVLRTLQSMQHPNVAAVVRLPQTKKGKRRGKFRRFAAWELKALQACYDSPRNATPGGRLKKGVLTRLGKRLNRSPECLQATAQRKGWV